MVKGYLDYIDKQDCERRGLVRDADGTYRLLNQLEKYERKGWLDHGNKYISSNERLSAGLRFSADYRKSAINTLGAVDLSKDRVDGGNQKELSPAVWDARTRFSKALRAINGEYLSVVVRVCLDDKPLNIVQFTKAQYNHDLAVTKEDLCRGLDDLAIHYGIKPVKPLRIHAYTQLTFWTDIEDYLKRVRSHVV